MTDYICTWWDRTERMTPFIDGISSPIFRNRDTGEERSSQELPIGALYVIDRSFGGKSAPRGRDEYPKCGADGLAIACKLPSGHHWYIDGTASNCTKREDAAHRCWIRHGTVGDLLTVDKAGNTCDAGGGSIIDGAGGWHGFLRAGKLVEC